VAGGFWLMEQNQNTRAVGDTYVSVCQAGPTTGLVTDGAFYNFESGTLASATGIANADTARLRLVNHVNLDPSWATLQFSATNNNDKDIQVTILSYDENDNYLPPSTNWQDLPYTYTPPAGAKKMSYVVTYKPSSPKQPINVDDSPTWTSISYTTATTPAVDSRCNYVTNNVTITPEFTITAGSSQGGNFVNGDLWLTSSASTDGNAVTDGTVRIYDIDYTTQTATQIHQFSHNFGHMNSYSYNRGNGQLVFGNGSGSYAQLPEFYTIKVANVDLDGVNTLSSVGAVTFSVPASFGAKCNVIWTDAPNIAVMLTDDGRTVRKIELATGTNQLAYGTYTAAVAGEYNGTFAVLETYDILTAYDVVQGAAWVNGKLVIGLGHGPLAVAVIDLLDGGFMDYQVYKDVSKTNYFLTTFYDEEQGVFGGNRGGTLYFWDDANFTFTSVNPNPDREWVSAVSEHVLGSADTLSIRIQKDIALVSDVQVDGSSISNPDQYIAVSGSTIVTLAAGFLNTLAAGNHTLAVVYSDGVNVSAPFVITANNSGGNNNNGGGNNGNNNGGGTNNGGGVNNPSIPNTGLFGIGSEATVASIGVLTIAIALGAVLIGRKLMR
jgi:hypothetical protein